MHLTSRTIIWLLVLMVIAIAGCNETTVEPVYNGRFHFPPDCDFARQAKSEGITLPVLEAFNGVYPERWPAGFKLPPETYLWPGTLVEELPPSRDENFTIMSFKSMAKGKPQEVVDYYKGALQAAQFDVLDQSDSFTSFKPQGGVSTSIYNLSATPASDSDVTYVQITFFEYSGYGDYTFLMGSVTLKK